MNKFPNRILSMPVEMQNLFIYFSDILAAKKGGRYDQGILDVGTTQEDHWKLVKTDVILSEETRNGQGQDRTPCIASRKRYELGRSIREKWEGRVKGSG